MFCQKNQTTSVVFFLLFSHINPLDNKTFMYWFSIQLLPSLIIEYFWFSNFLMREWFYFLFCFWYIAKYMIFLAMSISCKGNIKQLNYVFVFTDSMIALSRECNLENGGGYCIYNLPLQYITAPQMFKTIKHWIKEHFTKIIECSWNLQL